MYDSKFMNTCLYSGRRLACLFIGINCHSCTKAVRLAPVLKTIFHQCVISYTCSQSYSGGSVLELEG